MPPATDRPAGRAGYLGPEGTFSEEALLSSVDPTVAEPVPMNTIRDAVMAVQERRIEWALVPIENSIEGSLTITLDTLAGEASEVAIAGEVVLPVRHNLIAPTPLGLGAVETIVSHPHVPGQCSRFLHERLPHARIVAASSTAEAVRLVAEDARPGSAAIGTRLAADLYQCAVIAEGIQDREDNETRFVWLARENSPFGGPPLREPAGPKGKTSLVFWGAGADRAGWLVRCLDEFAKREINLTKIESRPMRERLGQYMFFLDLRGSLEEERVSAALAGLRAMCERVRVFGSYPTA
ncbi:MAG TPA: prephenate dehydratase [Solirubrobacteraceae bacterium]|jgi:prephenate dehydratase